LISTRKGLERLMALQPFAVAQAFSTFFRRTLDTATHR